MTCFHFSRKNFDSAHIRNCSDMNRLVQHRYEGFNWYIPDEDEFHSSTFKLTDYDEYYEFK